MELRHLRYFVAVAAEGSLTRAAERLHLTQPSLSRQIRQLERDIGAPLLERGATGTTLTPAGVALHSHAVLLLRLADATRETTHAAARRTREVVEIGIPPGLSADWLLATLAALDSAVPHAAVTLTEASSTDQLRMVREGRLDLGLVHEQPVGSLRGARLFDQPFGVAVRPGHPLADGAACRLRDLDGMRILAHGRQQVPVAHDRLVVAAHDAGVVPLWQFAQFSEHARACAEATKSDAVLLTEHSATRLLPGWPWRPVVEPALELVTWLVWQPSTRTVVDEVARTISSR
ncbi:MULTISPECIES: LysR family transcriptional regulator [Amycolatopsis]|uniref:LysR family transcriptional regulator n=1 Tax=Amycolatopsis thermalba TaxID=944492 RepID=A0ABY4NM10_9PSEU|nr:MULTISPECIES: LysR family transcriptional regulator [Amycolatopsis]OXM70135.1 LysR family transcriptional regulator [Amycolatopsis sp. KNN50.9b]UQS21483.1 LysR family transcriptional regulator [Amycolatopsis thermalba]